MNDSEIIIQNLGGTAEASRFFGVSMASVSGWKVRGFPRARLRHLQDAKPQALPEHLRILRKKK